MKLRTTWLPPVATAAFLLGAAFAQTPDYAPLSPDQDPPSRVARLNWLQGNVSFQPAGLDTWTDASLNYPLTTGDHLYSDASSRAEMHLGPNAFRLDSQSSFGFLNLDDRSAQIRFAEGALEVRLRRLDDDEHYEIDTPQAAISLLRTGDYRFDTDPARNATMITVLAGQADVFTNGRSLVVYPGQTAYVADGYDPDIRSANPPDDFDNFTRARNQSEDRLPPPVHVSESMSGYQDLDQYGDWNQTPDYGWTWAPRVAAGWAPYQEGHWAWVEPWGWTWIDQAPWGFAPFHYGRWAYARDRWLWVPGAVVARPVYAPALVAFVGGPRFGISLNLGGGAGAVGWFPLGPREPYYPAYHVSNTYIRQVNITHVTNVNVTSVTDLRYVNRQVPGAVVAMPRQSFADARSVRQFGRPVQARDLAQAQVIGATPQIAPRRESVLGAPGNRAFATPPPAVLSRPVMTRSTPPPAALRFEAREQLLQQNQGRPLAPAQLEQLRREPGAVMNRPALRPLEPAPAGRRFGRPSVPNQSPTGTAPRFDSRPPDATRPPEVVRPLPQAQPQPQFRSSPEQQPPVRRPDATPRQPQFRQLPDPQPQLQRPEPPREVVRPVPQAQPQFRRGPDAAPRPPEAVRPAPQRPPQFRQAPDQQPPIQRPQQRPEARPPAQSRREERKPENKDK